MYKLEREVKEYTGITGQTASIPNRIYLTSGGLLTIRRGHVWDGPTGVWCPSRAMLSASVVHDALYQLMDEKKLGCEYRKQADRLFRHICLAEGMNPFLAGLAYWAVRIFGSRHAGC